MASPVQAARPKRRADFAEALMGIACGIAVVTATAFVAQIPMHPAGERDYIVYWATAQQLVHHGNPYDANLMGMLEHASGLTKPGAFYMRNPPWSLPLVLPLGFVSAQVGAIPWSLLLIAILIAAVRIVWPAVRVTGKQFAWIGYVSPFALNCVISGQTSLFSLLGLALFLRLYRTRPFWAGASLALCTVKPHLLLVFAPVLLLWIVLRREFRVLLGIAAALAASCAVTELIDPAAWSQYLHWAANSGIAQEKIACLSVALRDLINPGANWLTYVPAALGCMWAVIYFWRRRAQWDWVEHGSVVILVSLVVAPYCWIWDQCLAIPALMFAACRTRSRWLLAALAVAYLLIDAQELRGVSLRSALYLWPAVFWLAWFLLARATASESDASTEAIPAVSPA